MRGHSLLLPLTHTRDTHLQRSENTVRCRARCSDGLHSLMAQASCKKASTNALQKRSATASWASNAETLPPTFAATIPQSSHRGARTMMRAPPASVLGAHQPGCTLTFSRPCSNQRGRPHSPATETSPPAETVRGAPAAALLQQRSCSSASQLSRSSSRQAATEVLSTWRPPPSASRLGPLVFHWPHLRDDGSMFTEELGHGQDSSRRGPLGPMALRVDVRFPCHTSARTPQHHRHQAHIHRNFHT